MQQSSYQQQQQRSNDKQRSSANNTNNIKQQLQQQQQRQDYQHNKENNQQLFDNLRILNLPNNRELQQSAIGEANSGGGTEGDGDLPREQDQTITIKRRDSRSNQKSVNKNKYQQQEQTKGGGGGKKTSTTIGGGGSMSSSFCIPQAAAQSSLSQQQLQQQIISINNSDFFLGSIQQSNYQGGGGGNNTNNNMMMGVSETLDSNGNEIRGRKIDSPHLLVVREIRELDEEEEREGGGPLQDGGQLITGGGGCDNIQGFGSGSEDLLNLIWNSRDLRQQQANILNESMKAGGGGGASKIAKHSKSLESRGFRQQHNQHTLNKQNAKLVGAHKYDKKQQQHSANKKYHHPHHQQRGGQGGTKSQRELRSSMGFNELLNQLDKDVSANPVNLNNDFKNRTVNDLLKLELSGLRQGHSSINNNSNTHHNNNQNPHSHNQSNPQQHHKQTKSKSKGRHQQQMNTLQQQKQQQNSHTIKIKPFQVQQNNNNTITNNNLNIKQQQPQRSRSREGAPLVPLKKTDQIRQLFSGGGSGDSTNIFKPQEIEKLMSLIKAQTSKMQQHQEGGLLQQNGRTKSQSSLGASGSGHFRGINNNNTTNNNNNQSRMNMIQQNQQQYHYQQKDQSSPDRGNQINATVKDYKPIGNIDKLIRENIKKNMKKEDEERFQKHKVEITIKQKKEALDKKNSQVRLTNQHKTYKKNQEAVHYHQQQQSQDPIFQSQGESGHNPPAISQPQVTNHHQVQSNNNNKLQTKLVLNKNWKDQIQMINQFRLIDLPQNKSQSQKIDFEKVKHQPSSKDKIGKDKQQQPPIFKNHRKSYGLEFIDIKKEIQEEMRTIDYKKGGGINNLSMVKGGGGGQSHKKLKIKQSSSKNKLLFKTNGGEEDNNIDKDIVMFKEGRGGKGVVLIKKSKIRKFMREKKKEMILQQWQEHNQEISKTMKMQENLNKLNLFCKKNLDKQQVIQKNIRKRNTTIQGIHLNTDPDQSKYNMNMNTMIMGEGRERSGKLGSKMSKRKKDQRGTGQKSNKKKKAGELDEDVGDSSKLSTEFYEEYFRLLNSIKKEQQESTQKVILSEGELSGTSFSQLQRQLLKSPQTKASNKTMNENSSRSPSSFQFNNLLQNNNKNTITLNADERELQAKHCKLNTLFHEPQFFIDREEPEEEQSDQIEDDDEDENLLEDTHHQLLLQNKVEQQSQLEQQEDDINEDDLNEEDEVDDEYETQVLDVNTVKPQGNHNNVKGKNMNGREMQRLQQVEDLDNYDEDEQDSGEFEEDEDQQMIIINQQANGEGDENKIIYMSNINSCSLPQTPKEEQIKKQIPQLAIHDVNHRVFDYQPKAKDNSLSEIDEQNQQKYKRKDIKQVQLQDDQNVSQESKELQKPKRFDLNIQEEEKQNESYGMRMFTGSESLLREFKLHTPKSSNPLISVPPVEANLKSLSVNGMSSQHSQNSMNHQLLNMNQQQFSVESRKSASNVLNENTSQSSQSLFDRNSFQQFTMQKLNQIIQNNEFSNLINMRSKALEYRQKKESKFIKKMLKNNQLSPRTYHLKKEQLEKWVIVEQEEIMKTKKAFQEEWQKTVQMIEDTQKNVDQMRQTMKISIDNNKHHQGIFNSQSSRNSSSNQSNIASVKQDSRRQINIDEGMMIAGGLVDSQFGELNPPLSQRSWRVELKQEPKQPSKTINMIDNSRKIQKIASEPAQPQQPTSIDKAVDNNLFDFLEENWQKQKQTDQIPEQTSSKLQSQKEVSLTQSGLVQVKHQNKGSNDRISRQGIYIEDQNERIQSSEQSDNDLALCGNQIGINNIQNQQMQQKLQPGSTVQEEERSLHRSRSEQDLKELIRNNKLDENEHYYDEEEGFVDQNNEAKYPPQKLSYGQLELSQKIKQAQIVIEENNFEDNSQNFYKNLHEDIESNDSYLNESDLNKYFQDQQFSLDDFKSLDKKKLIEKHEEDEVKEEEEQTARLVHKSEEILIDDQKVVQSKTSDDAKGEDFISIRHFTLGKDIDNENNLAGENKLNQQLNVHQFIDTDIMTEYQQSAFNQKGLEFQKSNQRAQQNIDLSAAQQQQALLFSNAKPGENIRIADILKKTQSLNNSGIETMNNFITDQILNQNQNTSSQFLFQNQHLNQIMSQPQNPQMQIDQHSTLINQITEELLQQILSSSLAIPQRHQQQSDIHNNLEQLSQQQQQHQQQVQTSLVPQNQPLENQDIFIIDAQLNEREQRREQIESRQRQLIESDLQKVEIYINEIIGTLLQSELQALTGSGISNMPDVNNLINYHRMFLNVLTNPIKKNELDILNQLQTSEIGSYEHFETTTDQSAFPILPIDLYLEIERQREEQIIQVNENGQHQLTGQDHNLESSVIQESIHIHNKAVFDALNESLMKFRPYGLQGEPMPWSNKNRRLQTRVDANSVDTERLFQMVKQDVLRWVATYSGCQPSPVFVFRKTNPQQSTNNPQIRALLGDQEMFDEEQFQETRERRLAQMLASEVVETEHQWLNYEFEEAQVKVDLSDMILEHLVEEIVVFMNNKNTNQVM